MSRLFRYWGLSSQLFCGALLSLLLAALAFVPSFLIGTWVLENTVYGEAFARQAEGEAFVELQEYVDREGIGQNNLHLLNTWCGREEEIYLSLYLDGWPLYESAVPPAILDPELFVLAEEDPECEHTLVLQDGTVTQAFLYFYAGDAYFYWVIVLSVLVAVAVFSVCFITIVHRKLRYITRLKGELDILAGGDLGHKVAVKGRDELSDLAAGIDQMRRSILAHQRAEEKMRSTNSQLVTAMSHDLRTPLTSLLAYLELLDRGKYDSEDQRRHFVAKSLEKALRIKSMADKLFEYFLVYSSEWEQADLEVLEADELFRQIWREYVFSLKSQGFQVRADFGALDSRVEVNVDLLHRAFDNLYANILKYADAASPVEVAYRRQDHQVVLTIANTVSPARDTIESTNIGLNTCRRIFQYHGGLFQAEETDHRFCVHIHLPFVGETPGPLSRELPPPQA